MSEDYAARIRAILHPYLRDDDAIHIDWTTPAEAKQHLARLRQMERELRLLKKDIDAAQKQIRASATAQRAGGLSAQQRAALRQGEQAALAPYDAVERDIEGVLVKLDNIQLRIKEQLAHPDTPTKALSSPPPGPGPGPGLGAPPRPPVPIRYERVSQLPGYTALPTRPPLPTRRRNPLLVLLALVGGGILTLCLACAALSLWVNNTVAPGLYATATAETRLAATAGVQATGTRVAQATQGAIAQATAQTEAAAATSTAEIAMAQATAAAQAALTPAAILGFQDTATFDGWVVSLGRIEARARLVTADNRTFAGSGRHWLVWLDARNTGPEPRAVAEAFVFHLVGSDGREYEELTPDNPGVMDGVAAREDRAPLSTVVAPNEVVHVLLIFDLAAATLPQHLILAATAPQPVRVWVAVGDRAQAVAQGTATAEAVAQAAATQEAAKAATARAVAARQTRTAVARAAQAPPPAPPKPSGGSGGLRYDPNGPDRDCGDFATHAEAQRFFIAAGGPNSDPHRLDNDNDGIACESLP